jgi:hypothetical protein
MRTTARNIGCSWQIAANAICFCHVDVGGRPALGNFAVSDRRSGREWKRVPGYEANVARVKLGGFWKDGPLVSGRDRALGGGGGGAFFPNDGRAGSEALLGCRDDDGRRWKRLPRPCALLYMLEMTGPRD